ncbi:ankyrin repeat domain-containing protein [Rickettsia asembonensis]|uniref:ankyrin repeat domain-containing protein n=1 Tax=Rickettsia asembonensis TaxID=1068590 RepID=UPI000693F109|nr:ankyrin repeat domain-containing protein [Rickettsia asembonensis]WCR57471.1 MAG: hypothetical protein PG979_001528 [Rickettsia asembonensis]
MIQEQSKASFKKLIKAMCSFHTEEATKLISQMDANELSKVDDEGKTALTHALEHNYDKICKLLLSKMSSKAINHVNGNGDTALTDVAKNFSTKICKLLIPKMSIEAFNHVAENSKTALSLAETKKFKNICSLLKAKQGDQIDTNTFEKIAAAIIIKLENDKTISVPNKNLFKGAINKIPHLTNTSDIVKITAGIKEFETGKITRGKLIDLNDELNEIINVHPIDDYVTILGAE